MKFLTWLRNDSKENSAWITELKKQSEEILTKPIGPTSFWILCEFVTIFFGVPLNPLLFLGVPLGLPFPLVGIFSIFSVGSEINWVVSATALA